MQGVRRKLALLILFYLVVLFGCDVALEQAEKDDEQVISTLPSSFNGSARAQYPIQVNYVLENGQMGEQTVKADYPSYEEARCEGKKVQLEIKVEAGSMVALDQDYDEEFVDFSEYAVSAITQVNAENLTDASGYATVDFNLLSGNDLKILEGANELFDEGEYTQSMMVLDGLSDAVNKKVCVLYLKGKITNEFDEFEASIDFLNQALEVSPLNDNLLYSRAYRYYKTGQIELALQDLDTSRDIEASHYEIYYLYDKIHSELGDYVQAIKYSSLGLDYRDDDYFYNLRGWNYYMNDNIELGELDFKKALELNPEDPNSYEGMAKIYSEQGAYERSLDMINKAIELDGLSSHRLNELGYYHDELGQMDQAIGYYIQVINEWEPTSTTYNNLGWVHLYNKRFGEAIVVFEEAIEKGLDSEILYNNLGTAYIKTGRYLDAIRSFQSVIDMDDGINAFAHAGVARAYIQLDELDKALTSIQYIQVNDPEYTDSVHNKWSLDSTPYKLLLDELESKAQNNGRDDLVTAVKNIREELE